MNQHQALFLSLFELVYFFKFSSQRLRTYDVLFSMYPLFDKS